MSGPQTNVRGPADAAAPTFLAQVAATGAPLRLRTTDIRCGRQGGACAVLALPLQLGVPSIAIVCRADGEFTDSEAARGRALADLVTAIDADVADDSPVGPPPQRPMRPLRAPVLDMLVGDGRDSTAIVAQHADGHLDGVANVIAYPDRPGEAEIAWLVADDSQRQGLGTVLLQALLQIASRRGLSTLVALTLPTNSGMQRLLRRVEGARWQHEDAIIRVELPVHVDGRPSARC